MEILINDEDVSPREDAILTAINQEVDMLGKELEDDIHGGTFNSSENKQCEILLGSVDGQCDEAERCEKTACAQIERATQLGNDVFKSVAADLVPRKSNLLSLGQAKSIASPLKESLSGMKSPKEDPNYHTDWTDMYGTHWIQFKHITTDMDVFVSGEELAKILNYGVTQDFELLPPTWVRGSSRANVFWCAFQPVLSAHFPPPTYKIIYTTLNDVLRSRKEKGAKRITHSWCIVVVNVELVLMVAVRDMILESKRKIC